MLTCLETYRRAYHRAGTGSRVIGSPGHRVSDYARVGSGLGSKLFTYRPGIVTRLLTEQQNDTAWLTHERIVEVEAVVKVCMKEDLN